MKFESAIRILVSRIFKLQNNAATSFSYDNYLLAEVVTKKTELYIAQRNAKNFPNSNYLALIAAMKTDVSISNIIDFGGAAGIHFQLVKYLFPNLNSWNVVETKAMVEVNKRQSDPILRFYTLEQGEELKINCDLLYSSSSLQYTNNPIETFKRLISFNPKHILISRTPFSNVKEEKKFTQYSSLSQNGPGPLPAPYVDSKVSYEVNIPILSDVMEVLSEKFEIQWITKENEVLKDPHGNPYAYLSIFATRK